QEVATPSRANSRGIPGVLAVLDRRGWLPIPSGPTRFGWRTGSAGPFASLPPPRPVAPGLRQADWRRCHEPLVPSAATPRLLDEDGEFRQAPGSIPPCTPQSAFPFLEQPKGPFLFPEGAAVVPLDRPQVGIVSQAVGLPEPPDHVRPEV